MPRAPFASFVVTLLLPACRPAVDHAPVAAAPAPVDTAAVKAGIADLWERFNRAEERRDHPALVETVAENVRVDGEGQGPLLGRPAFEAKAQKDFSLRSYDVVDFAPVSTTAHGPRTAYQYGTLRETHTPNGGPTQTAYGRWAGRMIQGDDAKWRIEYILGFLDSVKAGGK
jgi:hypothetical protein